MEKKEAYNISGKIFVIVSSMITNILLSLPNPRNNYIKSYVNI